MFNSKSKSVQMRSFFKFAFIPLLVFCCVLLIPFLYGLIMTLTDFDGNTITKFVGMKNYFKAFQDVYFWKSLRFTLLYVIITIVLVNIISFVLALIVTSKIKIKNALRSIFFMPNLMGGVILGFIWQFTFSKLIVYFGETFNVELLKYSWLDNTVKAFWAIVIVTIWQMSGYMMLIYITGLMNVPTDVLEAADLDGAGKLRQIISIKLPMIMQSVTITLFLTLKNCFMMYDMNLALTGGGPYRSTEMVTMHIYNDAFLYQNFAVGQAKAIIFFVIIASIALAQVNFTKRKEVAG